MTEIGRLSDAKPRDAWANEAQNFTPWLADHIDQLGEALGIKLEIEGREVAVETFSADILARNVMDDSLVLIENQLEQTDHTHLGQVMTYLAGLNAQTVIWIATDFREPHLSAIKWLNEHTVEPFAFFAVRLRVVRIGESPLAPIFEVLSRPNNWERQIQARSRASGEMSEEGKRNRDFWQAYLDRHPEDSEIGFIASGITNVWLKVDAAVPLSVSVFKTRKSVGVFVRGRFGADSDQVIGFLEPYATMLEEKLGAAFGPTMGYALFEKHLEIDTTDVTNWPSAIDWLHETAPHYVHTLGTALEEAT
jgi:hypothetical protein